MEGEGHSPMLCFELVVGLDQVFDLQGLEAYKTSLGKGKLSESEGLFRGELSEHSWGCHSQ